MKISVLKYKFNVWNEKYFSSIMALIINSLDQITFSKSLTLYNASKLACFSTSICQLGRIANTHNASTQEADMGGS